ncbi:hypothetical protein AVEN_222724-2-1, partial [Araneus ventricosus]
PKNRINTALNLFAVPLPSSLRIRIFYSPTSPDFIPQSRDTGRNSHRAICYPQFLSHVCLHTKSLQAETMTFMYTERDLLDRAVAYFNIGTGFMDVANLTGQFFASLRSDLSQGNLVTADYKCCGRYNCIILLLFEIEEENVLLKTADIQTLKKALNCYFDINWNEFH